LTIRPPPNPPLFPYTTLFRSQIQVAVIVIIRPGGHLAIDGVVQSRLPGDIRERAVTIVAEQAVPLWRSGPGPAGDVDVEPAVVRSEERRGGKERRVGRARCRQ